jgi:hypothetical protein
MRRSRPFVLVAFAPFVFAQQKINRAQFLPPATAIRLP